MTRPVLESLGRCPTYAPCLLLGILAPHTSGGGGKELGRGGVEVVGDWGPLRHGRVGAELGRGGIQVIERDVFRWWAFGSPRQRQRRYGKDLGEEWR